MAALLLVTGCALISPIKGQVPPTTMAGHDVLDDGYEEIAGVIHIHTVYSDGAGTFEDIARVANQQRLDYLIVTDHNTLKPLRDGKQGWYGMTLVLVGSEISTRGGHYLALNITEDINHHKLTTQQIIDEVNRQGGFGFIAHPYFQKRRWTDWTVRGFTGVEGYNVAHDSLDENKLRLALWGVAVPSDPLFLSMVDRPYDPLATWDELISRHGKVVGIGASDAHEVRLIGFKIAPYDIMFKLTRTHLLMPSPAVRSDADETRSARSGEPSRTTSRPFTAEMIYEALRKGHAFFSIDLLADSSGFTFMADDTRRVLGVMGDEVTLVPNLRLTAVLPAPAQLILFKDGQVIDSTTAAVWHVPVSEPGVYRLEVSRFGKPWIFSNPIYVRPPRALFGSNAWP